MARERFGADIAIYGSDSDRKAIKTVRLLLALTKVVLIRRKKIGPVRIAVSDMHKHLRRFARNSAIYGCNEYFKPVDGQCRAVELDLLVAHGRSGLKLGEYTIPLLYADYREACEEAMEIAKSIPCLPEHGELNNLLSVAEETLERMGVIPSRTAAT